MGLWRKHRWLLLILSLPALLLAAFALLSLDWRHEGFSTPRVVSAWHASGSLRVGAGKASLIPPFPTPVSGFNTRGSKPFHDVQSPLDARAIVIEVDHRRIGLMSVETVALPGTIRRQVIAATADLKLDDLVIAATHAHSGVGGYWNNVIARFAGMGPYDPKVEEFFVGQLVAALRLAAGNVRPAALWVDHRDAKGFSYNRNDANGAVDTRLTTVRFDRPDTGTIASLVVFAAHPTIINHVDMALSGDWPGALMRSLEANTGSAPALFLQGALGDATWVKSWGPETGQATANRFGEALAQTANDPDFDIFGCGDELGCLPPQEGTLWWSRARVGLPKCDVGRLVPPLFATLASNGFCWATRPDETDVSFLSFDALSLAFVPGEPVAALGQEWSRALHGATIVGLADDYVGYIEAPEVMQRGTGETKRTYFGPTLAPRLFDALKAAEQSARQ